MKDEGPGSIARARLLLLPKNMSKLMNKSSSCKLHDSMLSSQATRELSAFVLIVPALSDDSTMPSTLLWRSCMPRATVLSQTRR